MSTRLHNPGVPRRDLGEYSERLIFSLRHTRCCWDHGQWPGSCDGKPYAYTDRVQRGDVTEGGFEDYILSRTERADRLAALTPRQRDLASVYSWMGPEGPYEPYLWRRWAWAHGIGYEELRAAVKEAVRRMALGRAAGAVSTKAS